MNPYRQPALRYLVPKSLKTPLKRKIKFAWDRANNIHSLMNINSLFGFICLPIAVVCLPFEQRMIFPIGLIIVVILVTMLWSWCSFFIQTKQRNKRAIRMDELRNYKTFGFVSLPTGTKYKYICGDCNKCFSSKNKATIHVSVCHNNIITFDGGMEKPV